MSSSEHTIKSSKAAEWTQQKADRMLALVSMAWGSSYLLMKIGLDGIPPFSMVALRFGLALAAVALLFRRRLRGTTASALACGAVLGLLLFGVFGFLMYGLETTSASAAGFLTSTTVVFVPVLQALLLKRLPPFRVAAGTALTTLGIGLLTVKESLALSGGAVLCLLCALIYACHIILTDRLTRKEDGLLLGIWQLGFAGLYGLIASFVFETPALPSDAAQWGAVLGLALVCSAFGFVMQPVAQRCTTPEHTGLLFALEPVFSALFAFVFLHELLSARGWLGAALVLFSVLLVSCRSGRAAGGAKIMEG